VSFPGLIARRPLLTLGLVAALTAAAWTQASRLRLETSLETLLPRGAPASDDYRIFLERFGGLEKVFVLVLADGPGHESELAEAAGLLAEALEKSPEVASARSGVDPADEAFFLQAVVRRAPLLLGDGWRDEVLRRSRPEAIPARVAQLKANLLGPTGAARAPMAAVDPLGFAEGLRGLLSSDGSVVVDPLTMTFLSASGDAALVMVEPARAEIDP